jgi:hypothetical protein
MHLFRLPRTAPLLFRNYTWSNARRYRRISILELQQIRRRSETNRRNDLECCVVVKVDVEVQRILHLVDLDDSTTFPRTSVMVNALPERPDGTVEFDMGVDLSLVWEVLVFGGR